MSVDNSELVQDLLGPKYVCSKGRKGSTRVELACIKAQPKGEKRVFVNFVQKVKLLTDARDKLVAEGFLVDEDDIRDGWRDPETSEYVYWPHMWVGPAPVVKTPATDALIEHLQAMGYSVEKTDTDTDTAEDEVKPIF